MFNYFKPQIIDVPIQLLRVVGNYLRPREHKILYRYNSSLKNNERK